MRRDWQPIHVGRHGCPPSARLFRADLPTHHGAVLRRRLPGSDSLLVCSVFLLDMSVGTRSRVSRRACQSSSSFRVVLVSSAAQRRSPRRPRSVSSRLFSEQIRWRPHTNGLERPCDHVVVCTSAARDSSLCFSCARRAVDAPAAHTALRSTRGAFSHGSHHYEPEAVRRRINIATVRCAVALVLCSSTLVFLFCCVVSPLRLRRADSHAFFSSLVMTNALMRCCWRAGSPSDATPNGQRRLFSTCHAENVRFGPVGVRRGVMSQPIFSVVSF